MASGYDPLNNQEEEGTGATIGAAPFLSALGMGGLANALTNVQNKIESVPNQIASSITGMPPVQQPIQQNSGSITSGQPQSMNGWQGFGSTLKNMKTLMTPRGWN